MTDFPYWDISAFELFPPLSGEYNPTYPLAPNYRALTQRTRRLLGQRNAHELTLLAACCDQLMHTHFQYGSAFPTPIQHYLFENEQGEPVGPDSPLLELTKLYLLSDPAIAPDVEPPFTWSEGFALIALNGIAQIASDQAGIVSAHSQVTDALLLQTALDSLSEIANTVTLAELIWQQEKQHIPLNPVAYKEGVRINSKNAADKRHARTRKLKRNFILWYYDPDNANRYTSDKHAARIFYKDLTEKEKELTTNPERFFTNALREYRKTGKLPEIIE